MINKDATLAQDIYEAYRDKSKLAHFFHKFPDESWFAAISRWLQNVFIEVPNKIFKMLKKEAYWNRVKQAVRWERHVDYELISRDFEYNLYNITHEVVKLHRSIITDEALSADLLELEQLARKLYLYEDDEYGTPWFDWFKATTEERIAEASKRNKLIAKDKDKFYKLLQKHIPVVYS